MAYITEHDNFVDLHMDHDDESVAAVRIDGRVWVLSFHRFGASVDWFEIDAKCGDWTEINRIIDRDELERAQASKPLKSGAL